MNHERTTEEGPSKGRPDFAVFLRLAVALVVVLAMFFAETSRAQIPRAAEATWPGCADPTKIRLSDMEAGNLNKVPDKRSLHPPCTAYYELDGMNIASVYTGDCHEVASGYCDVHLRFNCNATAGCLFEIDQTWLAVGVQYPTGCSKGVEGLSACVKTGDVVSAKGFFFIDEGLIREFHPVASISVDSKASHSIPPMGGSRVPTNVRVPSLSPDRVFPWPRFFSSDF